jgi:hypothetical protein
MTDDARRKLRQTATVATVTQTERRCRPGGGHRNVTRISAIDDVNLLTTNRGTRASRLDFASIPATSAAAIRQSAQLPAFAPLLEDLEVAGWSSHRRTLSGNFHDWSLIEGRTLLAMAGQAVASQTVDSIDPIEAALVAQGAWASIRAHAHHASDAGTLLSLVAQSLWPLTSSGMQASVAIVLIDLDGGYASVAAAGDCLALKIRAIGSDPIATRQPALGSIADFMYLGHSIQLAARERIVLIADVPARRPENVTAKIANTFSRLDTETHRRMMAADAISLVRECFDQPADGSRLATSIVALLRR